MGGGGGKGSPAATPAAGLEQRRASDDRASRRRSGSRLRVSSASFAGITMQCKDVISSLIVSRAQDSTNMNSDELC